jgi:hypothetical protein
MIFAQDSNPKQSVGTFRGGVGCGIPFGCGDYAGFGLEFNPSNEFIEHFSLYFGIGIIWTKKGLFDEIGDINLGGTVGLKVLFTKKENTFRPYLTFAYGTLAKTAYQGEISYKEKIKIGTGLGAGLQINTLRGAFEIGCFFNRSFDLLSYEKEFDFPKGFYFGYLFNF